MPRTAWPPTFSLKTKWDTGISRMGDKDMSVAATPMGALAMAMRESTTPSTGPVKVSKEPAS